MDKRKLTKLAKTWAMAGYLSGCSGTTEPLRREDLTVLLLNEQDIDAYWTEITKRLEKRGIVLLAWYLVPFEFDTDSRRTMALIYDCPAVLSHRVDEAYIGLKDVLDR
jgi:hypothetical protein